MDDWEDMYSSEEEEPTQLEKFEDEEEDEWDIMVNDALDAQSQEAARMQNRNKKVDIDYAASISKLETHQIITIIKDIVKGLDIHSLTEINRFTTTQKNVLLKSTKKNKKKKNKKKLPGLKSGKFNDNILEEVYYD